MLRCSGGGAVGVGHGAWPPGVSHFCGSQSTNSYGLCQAVIGSMKKTKARLGLDKPQGGSEGSSIKKIHSMHTVRFKNVNVIKDREGYGNVPN